MIDLNTKIQQRGSIYFWKYKTDGWIGSEWHFSADASGREFFISLLDEMILMDSPGKYLITVTPVTQKVLRIPNFNSPFENRVGLKLTYSPFDAYYNEWSVSDNENIVDISFGKIILNDWRRAVLEVKTGKDDRSIGLNEDHTVFVW
jgi:hypothetical protein